MVTMDTLESLLVNSAGGKLCRPAYEEDLEKILSRGVLVDKKGAYLMKGRPNQCHENSALCWDANRDKSSIMTGYCLDGGLWRQHSWVIDNKGRIVETTFLREAYFGFPLNLEESEYFYFMNAD